MNGRKKEKTIIERKRFGIDKWVCKSQKNEGPYETINYWTEVVKSAARSDPLQRRRLKTHPSCSQAVGHHSVLGEVGGWGWGGGFSKNGETGATTYETQSNPWEKPIPAMVLLALSRLSVAFMRLYLTRRKNAHTALELTH
jgi:hypothetical protein